MSNIHDIEMRRRQKAAAVGAANKGGDPELPLFGGGGGGISGPMISLKDYVDKADEAVETRLTAKLDTLSTKQTVWAAVATILGVLLAVLAFGGDRFDAGLSLVTQQKTQEARDDRQDRSLQAIDQKLDKIIATQSRSAEKK